MLGKVNLAMEYHIRSVHKFHSALLLVILAVMVLSPGWASGALQFDFFPGYRGVLVQGRINPLTFEISNEEQGITGEVRVFDGNNSPVVSFPIEVPAKTRKRFQIPFQPRGLQSRNMTARLFDRDGKFLMEDERMNLELIRWPSRVFLSLSSSGVRKFSKPPALIWNEAAQRRMVQADFLGHYFNIQPEELSDRSLLHSGVGGIFINSEVIGNLTTAQIYALLKYVESGGVLVLSVSQPGELSQSSLLGDWLGVRQSGETQVASVSGIKQFVDRHLNSQFLPYLSDGQKNFIRSADKGDIQIIDDRFVTPAPGDIQAAVHDLTFSDTFERLHDSVSGQTILHHLKKGQGEVIVLPWNIHRSTIEDWPGFHWFWIAAFEQHTGASLEALKHIQPGGRSLTTTGSTMVVDNWMGRWMAQLVKTVQIKEIPVFLISIILVGYLLVIGPVDWIVLKRLKKQMWTWVTFPVAVIIFSCLIYYVGFMIRSGRTEWRSIHVVDMGQSGDGLPITGVTYAGIYSPVNRNYQLRTGNATAVFTDPNGNSVVGSFRTDSSGASTQAEIFVPVWTSTEFSVAWELPSAAATSPVDMEIQYDQVSGTPESIQITPDESVAFIEWFAYYGGVEYSVRKRNLDGDSLVIPLSSTFEVPSGQEFRSQSLNKEDHRTLFISQFPARVSNNYGYYNQSSHRDTQNGILPGDPIDVSEVVDVVISNPASAIDDLLSDRLDGKPESWPLFRSAGPAAPWVDHQTFDGHIILLGVVDGRSGTPVEPKFNARYTRDLSIYRWVIPVTRQP